MSPILPEPEPELACLCPLGDASSDLNKKKFRLFFLSLIFNNDMTTCTFLALKEIDTYNECSRYIEGDQDWLLINQSVYQIQLKKVPIIKLTWTIQIFAIQYNTVDLNNSNICNTHTTHLYQDWPWLWMPWWWPAGHVDRDGGGGQVGALGGGARGRGQVRHPLRRRRVMVRRILRRRLVTRIGRMWTVVAAHQTVSSGHFTGLCLSHWKYFKVNRH